MFTELGKLVTDNLHFINNCNGLKYSIPKGNAMSCSIFRKTQCTSNSKSELVSVLLTVGSRTRMVLDTWYVCSAYLLNE